MTIAWPSSKTPKASLAGSATASTTNSSSGPHEMIQPEFAPSTWNSFRLLVFEERPASEVAETLGLSVNAVLIAKSRVLRRLRQEGQGLVG